MKKVVVILLALILCACSSTANEVEEKQFKIIVPKGSAALSLVFAEGDITFVDGTDAISAAFLNPSAEYDVIIAPLNLGAKIITESNSPYRLYAVITWGNLYFVENVNAENDEIALFGEGAVPQKIVNTVLDLPEDKIIYYPNVTEAQVALLSGKVKYALLAEPAYTATLLKAQEAGMELNLVYDLQEEWASVKGVDNYPQAAVFVKEASFEEHKEAFSELEKSLSEINFFPENEILIREKLEGKAELFGIPAIEIVMKAWANLNLEFRLATEVEEEIINFLELFNILNISDFFIK